MKKLIFASLCFVSLVSFSQNKKKEVLTYVAGQGTGSFYIPAESDFVEGQELFIKDKSRGNVGITFFKTTSDTLDYYVDIHSPGEKGIVESISAEFGKKSPKGVPVNKCTSDYQPYFVLMGSGQKIITLKRGNIVRTYKLNLELEK